MTARTWRTASAGRLVATGLAICLAGLPAWGHSFPPVHTVVVQVERCEVALLVGYTAGSGEPTERVIARAASQPKSHALEALRDTLAAFALAPLVISVDGVALAPTAVHAKLGLDPGGTRPSVVVLATFALPAGDALAIRSKDPRTTRISWQDRASGRVAVERAPAQGHWYTAVASFLLPLAASGGSACASSAPSSGSPSHSAAPH